LIDRLSAEGKPGCVFLGVDFPIGLPLAYARAAGIPDFKAVLTELGRGRWSSFYDLAEKASEISLGRPFYPARPGGTSHADLLTRLGVASMQDLLRVCERRTAQRGDACPLFWTLGGKQVGRAAISGWRHVLAPAISKWGDAAGLWPFDGDLMELLAAKRIVFAETYPAEACVQLGMTAPGRGWSKRVRDHRPVRGGHLLTAAKRLKLELTPCLKQLIDDGFGSGKDGEDRFDSVAGILSMLNVVIGERMDGAPTSAAVRKIEGWIFGQSAGA
jgi:hypothetical protein